MERPKTTDKECKRQGMTDVPIANYSKMQDKYIDYLESQAKQRAIGELEVALSYFEEDGLYAVKGLKDRIKQLKQD